MAGLSVHIQHTKAILIGNSDFDFLPAIGPAANNVQDMAALLSNPELLGLLPENIIQRINLRDDALLDLVAEFIADPENADVETLIFYYAGHGYRDPGSKELYLAGVNSKPATIRVSGIPFSEIKNLLEQSQIQNRIVFLDACHSGLAAMDGGTAYTENELDIKGSYILTSSAGTEKSYFESGQRNTFFTGELLDFIRNGSPVSLPFLSLDFIFRHLSSRLQKSAPQRKTNLNVTDFFLFCNRAYDNFSTAVFQADRLFEQARYAEARAKYLEANFSEPSEALRQKIQKCDEYLRVLKTQKKPKKPLAAAPGRGAMASGPAVFKALNKPFLYTAAGIILTAAIFLLIWKPWSSGDMLRADGMAADSSGLAEQMISQDAAGTENPEEQSQPTEESSAGSATASVPKTKPQAKKKGEVVWKNEKEAYYIDPRDNHEYRVVRIGSQIIMGENMAYKPPAGKYWAYENKAGNVAKYGYLYDWETAKTLAPPGWHLPSKEEWAVLYDFVNLELYDNKKVCFALKEGGSSGFDAVMGGSRSQNEDFEDLFGFSCYWSSTIIDSGNAHCFIIAVNNIPRARILPGHRKSACSVRLFKD